VHIQRQSRSAIIFARTPHSVVCSSISAARSRCRPVIECARFSFHPRSAKEEKPPRQRQQATASLRAAHTYQVRAAAESSARTTVNDEHLICWHRAQRAHRPQTRVTTAMFPSHVSTQASAAETAMSAKAQSAAQAREWRYYLVVIYGQKNEIEVAPGPLSTGVCRYCFQSEEPVAADIARSPPQ